VELSERKVRAQVRDLVARAKRAETLAQIYDGGILPQAQSALDAASAAYAVGRTDFLTLLDDFLKLLNYEIESETQKAERVKFLAALEPLTGEVLVVP
jgi:outer membrane protein TolC